MADKDCEAKAIAEYRRGNKKEACRQYIRFVASLARDPAYAKSQAARVLYNEKFFLREGRPAFGPKVAILCFESPAVGNWDPGAAAEGLPGSEEAVVHVAALLAARGFDVQVFASPPFASLPWTSLLSNPCYRHVDRFTEGSYDVAISWRRKDFAFAKLYAKRVVYWPHDLDGVGDVAGLDAVLWLSEFEKEHYCKNEKLRAVRSVVAGNGIAPEHFPRAASLAPRANPHSCGYFSNYARGLEILLDLWGEVRARFPAATLDIYYGRQTWGNLNDDQMASILRKIEVLKDQGVCERGKVGHAELARAMQGLSFWTYPCTTAAETYCITAVKAQAAGMVPVATRIGALAETIHPEAPTILDVNAPGGREAYLALLLDALGRADHDRNKYVEFGLARTWDKVADGFVSLFQ